jgi:hypothetical protein
VAPLAVEGLHFGQGLDYISKSAERLVDFLALFKSLTCCACDIHALTASKINEIKFSNLYLFVLISHLFYHNDKYRVGPRAHVIHASAGLNPGGLPLFH